MGSRTCFNDLEKEEISYPYRHAKHTEINQDEVIPSFLHMS
jgi:hypothetical protein